MKNKKVKKIFRSPWFIGITVTAIGSVLAESFSKLKILTAILKLFINIKNLIFKFFSASISIPLWIFILLLIVGVVFVVLILLSLLGKKESLPSVEDYTQDEFDGIVWRWRWHFNKYGKRYEIKNLAPFCLKCDCQLFLPYRNVFKCPNCDIEYNDYPKSMIELELIIRQRATRIISQKQNNR